MNGCRKTRRSMAGMALIEALVSLLIICVGIVGLVGMQASMTRAQSDGKFRADAAYLGNELVALVWADRPNLDNYVTTPTNQCAGHNRCSDWVAKVASSLPNGKAEISTDTSTGVKLFNLKVTWSIGSYGTRTYAASTAIQ
jgi:type IV pilus assembly protein PilV